jgi:hypothetical protein
MTSQWRYVLGPLRDRQDVVELGDARIELLANPGHRRRAAIQRLDGPLLEGA